MRGIIHMGYGILRRISAWNSAAGPHGELGGAAEQQPHELRLRVGTVLEEDPLQMGSRREDRRPELRPDLVE
jgi:hypothetical protein